MLQYALSADSLLQENPTVDEVVHMPAGITYWQRALSGSITTIRRW